MDMAPQGWLSMDRWSECRRLERPGYVVEIENAEGMKVWTGCLDAIEVPFDWTSPPLRFRLVPKPPPARDDPLPPAVGPQ